jgi:hypothetical protein
MKVLEDNTYFKRLRSPWTSSKNMISPWRVCLDKISVEPYGGSKPDGDAAVRFDLQESEMGWAERGAEH